MVIDERSFWFLVTVVYVGNVASVVMCEHIDGPAERINAVTILVIAFGFTVIPAIGICTALVGFTWLAITVVGLCLSSHEP